MKNKRWIVLGLGLWLVSDAHAMEFACSPIEGAGAGDFEFSEICLNDEYAVLRTGTFESSNYLYRVTFKGSDRYSLTPVKTDEANWESGLPITATAEGGGIGCDPITPALLQKKVSLVLDGGPRQKGSYRAAAFERRQIPITL